MGMRKKLIELLSEDVVEFCNVDIIAGHCKIRAITFNVDNFADHLIANGVTIPVRCKDCKHYDNTEGIHWCHLNSKFGKFAMDWHSFPEDGFCSYGEKQEV